MIETTSSTDYRQLKDKAVSMLERNQLEGLIILVNELNDYDFNLPSNFRHDRACRWCCRFGHTNIFKYLISQSLSIQEAIEKSDLLLAIAYKHIELIKYVVEDLGVSSILLREMLRYAARCKRLAIVKYLVDRGAIADHDILQFAAIGGSLLVVKYLIKLGVSIRDSSGSVEWIRELPSRHIKTNQYLSEVSK